MKALAIILGVIVTISVLFSFIEVDPASMLAGQRTSEESLSEMRTEMGLNDPILFRIGKTIALLSPIYQNNEKWEIGIPTFGTSFFYKREVSEIILPALGSTIILAFLALLIAIILGIPLGVITALKPNSILDKSSLLLGSLSIAFPSYFVALILMYFLAWKLGSITHLPLMGGLFDYQGNLQLQNLILPSIALGIRPIALISQLTRSAMLEVLNQDYMLAVKAQGIPKLRRLFKFALKNALSPVLTALSGWFASLLAGAYFIEVIFNYKGLGYVTVQAINQLDIPVVLGSVVISATIFVGLNALNDLLQKQLNPKLKA